MPVSKGDIIIRVDASVEIGAGHVMRCLAIARAFQGQGYTCTFLCRLLDGNLNDYIRSESFSVIELSKPKQVETLGMDEHSPSHARWLGVSWKVDAVECEAFLNERSGKPVLLIVDSYALDFQWELAMTPLVEKIMVIDDLVDRRHDCDFLLDQTFGRQTSDYSHLISDRCNYVFCGANYALLRPEFAAERPFALSRRNSTKTVQNIFISMGGVDKNNVTGMVLNELESLSVEEDCLIQVVLRVDAPYFDAVSNQVKESHLNIDLLPGVNNMAELMANADIAIGAAGGTAWERCCLGLPALMTVLADNQSDIAIALEKSQVVKLFDWQRPNDFQKEFKEFLQDYRDYSLSSARVCDGLGLSRLVNSVVSRLTGDELVAARSVHLGDAKLLYRWQCHPETRKHSFNTSIPSWDEHCAWLEGNLANCSVALFVIDINDRPCSCLRLDWSERGRAEVSIYVAPNSHGLGVGTKSLSMLRRMYPSLIIDARILLENHASIKLFKKCNFVQEGDEHYVSYP
jgi:UDP-2,4-diacetamido-2,4,6-trideoxy-beta-L-altropyranose hydrolase